MGSLQSIEQSIALATKRVFAAGADEDVGPGLIVQYIGSEASGTVTVTVTSGDITFKHGDVGSEAVDATIDSGLWSGDGTDPGVIDMSDSSNLTAVEVENLINGSTNWRARLTGLLPDDAMPALLLTMAATQAKVAAGIPLYVDGTVLKFIPFPITGVQFNSLSVEDGKSSQSGMVTDEACENWLDYAFCNNASASGDSEFRVYTCAHGDAAGVEIYSKVLATATDTEFGDAPNPSQPFLKGAIGQRLVCRIFNPTDALTINEFRVHGRVVDYAQVPRAT